MKAKKILRPDSKGRICLGSLAKGISGYKAVINENTKEITLKPYRGSYRESTDFLGIGF